jgi:hypothetical protein
MAAASTLLYNEIMAHLKVSSPALHYEIVAAAGKNPMVADTVSVALAVDTLMEAYYASSPTEDAGHLSDYRLATWDNPLVGTPADYTEFNTLYSNIGVRLAEFDDELEAESEATYHYGMEPSRWIPPLRFLLLRTNGVFAVARRCCIQQGPFASDAGGQCSRCSLLLPLFAVAQLTVAF